MCHWQNRDCFDFQRGLTNVYVDGSNAFETRRIGNITQISKFIKITTDFIYIYRLIYYAMHARHTMTYFHIA